MTECYGGFGEKRKKCGNLKNRSGGFTGAGHLSYVPKGASYRNDYADFVVDNLATMLTSGRLSKYHHQRSISINKISYHNFAQFRIAGSFLQQIVKNA